MQIKYSLVNAIGAILGFISLGLNWMNVHMSEEYTNFFDLLMGGSGTQIDDTKIPISLDMDFMDFYLDGYSNIPTIIIIACVIALISGISIENPERDQPIYKIFSLLSLIAGILFFVAVIYLYSILNESYYDPDLISFNIILDVGAILALCGGSMIFLGLFSKKISFLNFNDVLLYSN